MTIKFNEKNREFHLYNKEISYIFRVIDGIEQLEQLYFGKVIKHREAFSHLVERDLRSSNNIFEGSYTSSLDHIKQEYPSYGTTDYRYPAYRITDSSGSSITSFIYMGHRVLKGKPSLDGLPAVYTEEDSEAETLEIYLEDEILKAKLILSYTIFQNHNMICRSARIENNSKDSFFIDSLMSMSLDLPDSDYSMVYTSGAWAREGHLTERALKEGLQGIQSLRGASSHMHNPYLILKRPNTTEDLGEAFGFSLIYSGNFLGQIEVDNYQVSRVLLGINPFNFKWKLSPGEVFQSPEAVMSYSDKGLNKLSQGFHKLYSTRLVRGPWRDRRRPILINNWEATYFDFNEEKLLDIARKASAIGIELFVLDDGWFGRRNNDKTSLGDWFVNKDKLPEGIEGFSKKVEDMGMLFGLWFEPEMVSKDSHIFIDHPEWVIHVPGRNMSHGRNQYVLDFSRAEVVEYIFKLLKNILSTSRISYIKWDMNRYITEPYSTALGEDRQGEVFHRYILGVYSLLEKITKTFPNLLIESCAGGGARFDPGMLYYSPQIWTSDDSDAIERLRIQQGMSMVYPLSSIGAHVSAVPNHQVGRVTPLNTRANVAYFGTFGYELNLKELSNEELMEIKEQIAFFKKHSDAFHKGDFYRLINPDNNFEAAWMVVAEDKSMAIIGVYDILARPNPPYRRVKVRGLDEDRLYRIEGKEGSFYGDELMNIGIPMSEDYTNRTAEYYSKKRGDFISSLIIIKEVQDKGELL